MAISLVGQAQAASTSLTYPGGIAAGDLILYFAYRNTTTAPTLPTGFTNFTNGSGNANAYRLCYKWATGSESGASPTFTNASGVEMVIYRGVSWMGNSNDAPHAASTTMAFLAMSPLENTNGNSWVILFGGSKQSTSTSTPTGFTLRGSVQNVTSGSMAVFDSNGGLGSFAGVNSTLGASATYGVVSLELKCNDSLDTFADPFTGSVLDSNKWDNFVGTGGTIAVNNDLEFTATGASAQFSGVISHRNYDMTGAAVYLQITDYGTQTWTTKELSIYVSPHSDPNTDSIFVIVGDGSGSADTFAIYKRVATTQTQVFSATLDTTNHRWIRIRESSGNILVDTAPDTGGAGPGAWTNRYSAANPWTPVYAIRDVAVEIDFGNWGVESGSTTAKLDNVNTTPSAVPANLFFF